MSRLIKMRCSNIVFITVVLFFNLYEVYTIPGIKSIKQCHKYNNLRFSLTNLQYYQPMTNEDLQWIQKQDADETVPTWINNPAEDIIHNFAGGRYAAVGGVDANYLEYPFMAALGFGDADNKQYYCGGSLISEDFVITAAHCIFSGQREPVKYVRLGNVKLIALNDSKSVQEIDVLNYYIHPNYTFAQRYHDIALLKLATPAVFTKFVKPICLEYERKPLRYRALYAAGWGLLGNGEERSNHLQKVVLRLYAITKCRKTYMSDNKLPNGIVEDHQICAGSLWETNITDTCEGDSGGPLLYEGTRFEINVKYLTGIISFGIPCGIAPLPAIYTRVSHYIDWIEKIVWPDK